LLATKLSARLRLVSEFSFEAAVQQSGQTLTAHGLGLGVNGWLRRGPGGRVFFHSQSSPASSAGLYVLRYIQSTDIIAFPLSRVVDYPLSPGLLVFLGESDSIITLVRIALVLSDSAGCPNRSHNRERLWTLR